MESREGIQMLLKHVEDGRNQIEVVALDQLVPEDHLVRKMEQAIDFEFIYDLVKDKYCLDNGRPSIDSVVLIKMVFIQYLFGIRFHTSNHKGNRNQRGLSMGGER